MFRHKNLCCLQVKCPYTNTFTINLIVTYILIFIKDPILICRIVYIFWWCLDGPPNNNKIILMYIKNGRGMVLHPYMISSL